MSLMAGRAQDLEKSAVQPVPTHRGEDGHAVVEVPRNEIQEAAARLYGQGLTRSQVMRILVDLLAPKQRLNGRRDRTREEQETHARAKLRRWEGTQKFRDMVYDRTIVE